MNAKTLNKLALEAYDHQISLANGLDLLAQFKIDLARLDADIEAAIAENPALKNEQQRKAAKLEARDGNEYQLALAKVKDMEDKIRRAEAMERLARNQLDIAKLAYREAIATIERAA